MSKFILLMMLSLSWGLAGCGAQAGAEEPAPLAGLTHGWEQDPTWYDGTAEVAVYEATRSVEGAPRQYEARIYTNKEQVDPQTHTKAGGEGIEAFKYHIREDIPATSGVFHFSTMSYTRTDDFRPLKLDMGSQENCGASFKQYINHAGFGEGSTIGWRQFSYFPDEGHKDGELPSEGPLVFADALGLVLRGYPFGQPRELTVRLLPSQVSPKLTPHEPVEATVRYAGRETLALPIGEVAAHHLEVTPAGGEVSHYWFAAEGGWTAGEPGLHVMVQQEGPGGQSYRLKSIERRAYWDG